jgi:iodotyrosine deiodinase
MNKIGFHPLNFYLVPEQQMLVTSKIFLLKMKERRSVREFSSKTICREVIENCIEAAATAPSGANKQPWKFVVVTNPEIKKRIRKAAEEEEKQFYSGKAGDEWLEALIHLGTDEDKPFLEKAPYLIVIFEEKYSEKENGSKEKNYYTKESVGIATGLLITALHYCGLVTLTYTPSPMKFLNNILNRPQSEKPFLILVVGYPAEEAKVPEITKKILTEVAVFI